MRTWWYWQVVADKNMLSAANLSRAHFSFRKHKTRYLIFKSYAYEKQKQHYRTQYEFIIGTKEALNPSYYNMQFCKIYENFITKRHFPQFQIKYKYLTFEHFKGIVSSIIQGYCKVCQMIYEKFDSTNNWILLSSNNYHPHPNPLRRSA